MKICWITRNQNRCHSKIRPATGFRQSSLRNRFANSRLIIQKIFTLLESSPSKLFWISNLLCTAEIRPTRMGTFGLEELFRSSWRKFSYNYWRKFSLQELRTNIVVITLYLGTLFWLLRQGRLSPSTRGTMCDVCVPWMVQAEELWDSLNLALVSF